MDRWLKKQNREHNGKSKHEPEHSPGQGSQYIVGKTNMPIQYEGFMFRVYLGRAIYRTTGQLPQSPTHSQMDKIITSVVTTYDFLVQVANTKNVYQWRDQQPCQTQAHT